MSADEFDRDGLKEIVKQFQQPGDPDYYNNMGMVHRSRGDLDSAIREFREAIRLKPDDAMFRCNLASVWAEKGEHLMVMLSSDAWFVVIVKHRLSQND